MKRERMTGDKSSYFPDIAVWRRALSDSLGGGVKVAVIDSGIEIEHPDFQGRGLVDDLVLSCDTEAEDFEEVNLLKGSGVDVFGHGTAVAAALWEIAPEAEIGSFRVLGDGVGNKSLLIARAATEAMNRGYQILNCSLGCHRHSHWSWYKTWLDRAYLEGVQVVAACSNEDEAEEEWPAYFSSVVSVDMAQIDDPSEYFHRLGRMVSFAASGVDLFLPWRNGQRLRVSGSSFAAPRLAGILARLLAVVPTLSAEEGKALLRHLAKA